MKKIRFFLYFLLFILIFSGCSNQVSVQNDYVDVKINFNLPEIKNNDSKGRKITEYKVDDVFENLVYVFAGQMVDKLEEGFIAEAESYSDLCNTNFHLLRNQKYNISLNAYNPGEYKKAKEVNELPAPILIINDTKTLEINRGKGAFEEISIDLIFNPESTECGFLDYQIVFPKDENLSLYVEMVPVKDSLIYAQSLPSFDVFSELNKNLEIDSDRNLYIANISSFVTYGIYTLKLQLKYNDTNEVYSTYGIENVGIYPLVTTKGNYEFLSYNRTYSMKYDFGDTDYINEVDLPNSYAPWESLYLPEITIKEEYSPYVIFTGWDCIDTDGYYVSISKTDKGYCFNESFDVFADVTLSPKFEFNDVRILYYANNGTEDCSSEIITFNQPYTILKNIFEYDNYTFIGWATTPDAITPEYSEGFEVEKLLKNISLYAVWNYNGKTKLTVKDKDEKEIFGSLQQDFGSIISLVSDDETARIFYTKDGSDPFIPENSDLPENLYEYNSETKIVIDGEFTLKAIAVCGDKEQSNIVSIEVLLNQYTVTFSSGDAKDTEHTMATLTVKSNEDIILPECEYVYAKHHFYCWQCSSNGVFVSSGAKITIQNDITYTAQWIANGTTSPVEFSLTPQEDNKCYVDYGRELAITCEDRVAKIYYTTDGSNPYQYPDRVIEYTEPIKLTSEITIKAYAENEDLFGCSVETINILFNEYTISFSSGEANDTEHTVDDIVVKDGKLELPECEYIYPKHTFIGWNWNDQNFKLPGELLDSCFLNITYTACWKENGTTLPVEFSVIPEEGNLCTVDYGTELELSCASEGAKIYYTTDGSNPFENPDKVEYTKPIKLTSEMTITAYAECDDLFASENTSVIYKIGESLIDDVKIEISKISSSFNGLLLTFQRLYDDQGRYAGMNLKASGKEYIKFVWWLNGEIVKDESSNAITSDEITIPFDIDITEYTVYCQAMTPEYDVDDVTYFFKIEN